MDTLRHPHTIAHSCSSRQSRLSARWPRDTVHTSPGSRCGRGSCHPLRCAHSGMWTRIGHACFITRMSARIPTPPGMCLDAQGLPHPPWAPRTPQRVPPKDGYVPSSCPVLLPYTEMQAALAPLSQLSVPKCSQMPKHPRLRAEQDGRGRVTLPSLRR